MSRASATPRRARRAVGYIRRSTDRQEQSIPDQKRAIEGYAAENGLRLSKCYVDDAISGASTVGRKAFQQMIQDAQGSARPFDAVIVYDVKRFGRIDNDEAGYYRHLLRKHGVDVCYVSENFNGDATDDLLRPVKQWQARQESKDLSKVTIRGLMSKMQDRGGWWMGGVPPYGYDLQYEGTEGQFLMNVRYMPDGCKRLLDESGALVRILARGESLNISKRDRAKLVPSSPERVTIIQRIFRMYAEHGKGFKSVAESLNLDNVPTPRGPAWSHIYSGKWTDTTIRSILVNPIYVGDMVWNRRTDARFHQIRDGVAVERESICGARLVPNSESNWLIVREAHPALISRRVFEQARQRRENHIASIEQRGRDPRLKTSGRNWHGQRSRFILSGLLTCARCGNRYHGVTRHKGKRRSDQTKVVTRSYGCGGHITKGNKVCAMNAIPQDQLEGLVIETVIDFYRRYDGKAGKKLLRKEVKAQLGGEGQHVVEARRRAQAEESQLQHTINNLLDNITPTNREFVDQRLKELTERRRALEFRLEELDRITAGQAEVITIVADAGKLLAGLPYTLHEAVPQEKLVALRQCIERIHIDKPNGQITLHIYPVPTGNMSVTHPVCVALAGPGAT